MVADLLGFTRTQLGSKMPVMLALTDVKKVCEEAVEDAAATHPGTTFEVQASGNLGGSFDPVRLHQLFANLLVNAAQYGAKDQPVVISASNEGTDIVVKVTNRGVPSPETAWR